MSMSTKAEQVAHTPGPWLITGEREDFIYASVPNPEWRRGRPENVNRFSLRLQSDNGIASDGEIRANARLIAAAPDLLEALKDAVQTARNYYALFHDETWKERAAKWNAAIAKATGQPSE